MPSPKKVRTKTPAELLGENVRRRREEMGLSQDELAARAKMDLANLSRVENGRSGSRGPTLTSITQLASALDLAPAELLRF